MLSVFTISISYCLKTQQQSSMLLVSKSDSLDRHHFYHFTAITILTVIIVTSVTTLASTADSNHCTDSFLCAKYYYGGMHFDPNRKWNYYTTLIPVRHLSGLPLQKQPRGKPQLLVKLLVPITNHSPNPNPNTTIVLNVTQISIQTFATADLHNGGPLMLQNSCTVVLSDSQWNFDTQCTSVGTQHYACLSNTPYLIMQWKG